MKINKENINSKLFLNNFNTDNFLKNQTPENNSDNQTNNLLKDIYEIEHKNSRLKWDPKYRDYFIKFGTIGFITSVIGSILFTPGISTTIGIILLSTLGGATIGGIIESNKAINTADNWD